MEKTETYTTKAPDGTYLTTTTRTQTKYDEDMVYGFGRGSVNRNHCLGPQGILRIIEIVSFSIQLPHGQKLLYTAR